MTGFRCESHMGSHLRVALANPTNGRTDELTNVVVPFRVDPPVSERPRRPIGTHEGQTSEVTA